MSLRSRAAVVGAAATLVGLVGAVPAQAATRSGHDHHQPAVFVQTDDPAGNAVVAYARHGDGTLHAAGTYPTGGNGGVLDGSVVDHLASQGSLTLDREHGLLYAVNAGSDTLTVFAVSGSTLHRLQVAPTHGSFPVSVTTDGSDVYVLNARNGGSLQGYRWHDGRLVSVPSWHRELGLTEPAPEFTHTPGQVAFTPDGRQLLVTTKAASNAVLDYRVHDGRPSQAPVVTTFAGAVPFAVDFDAQGHAVLAEAGTNAVVTLAVAQDGALGTIATVATGQAATCWVVVSGRSAYVSNAGSATLSGYRLWHGQLQPQGTTATDPGTVDAAAASDGRWLDVQTGRTGAVDTFRIGADGTLTAVGSVVVPGAVGGEGIAAS